MFITINKKWKAYLKAYAESNKPEPEVQLTLNNQVAEKIQEWRKLMIEAEIKAIQARADADMYHQAIKDMIALGKDEVERPIYGLDYEQIRNHLGER